MCKQACLLDQTVTERSIAAVSDNAASVQQREKAIRAIELIMLCDISIVCPSIQNHI